MRQAYRKRSNKRNVTIQFRTKTKPAANQGPTIKITSDTNEHDSGQIKGTAETEQMKERTRGIYFTDESDTFSAAVFKTLFYPPVG